jgi:hypothetical protein
MDGLIRYLKGLNGMDLSHNSRMPFFNKIFDMVGVDDLWITCYDFFKSVVMPFLLETHV